METRALIARRSVPRVLYAAALLSALLAALLGAWFVSGWHDVRMRQHDAGQAPRIAALQKAEDLARELHGELEALIGREVRRPYFHYQNLMHDPGASPGVSVSPSPLAAKPEDKLVLGYFQIDGQGRTTTPTINDEVPDHSDHDNLLANQSFRDQVVRDFVRELTPRPEPPVVAQRTQVIEIDSSVYAQNASSNAVYWQQHDNNNVMPAKVPGGAVTITVSPLEWRTLPFAGKPALVAVRLVQTPDGTLVQGFVVDRTTLTSWLAGKAGDMVAELRAPEGRSDNRPTGDHFGGDAAGAPEVVSGWQLTVAPNPRTLTRAAGTVGDVATAFLIRFIAIGAVAVCAAGFVLLLVMRAEHLARERSQFAAAAAHELRTPLAGLQLYGDMLADGLGDPGKLRDYARRMSEEASRLGRVVSNVLGFSQLERGNLSVDAQVGPVGEALCELAERAKPNLDRAGAALDLAVEPDLCARFDRDALARIVGNLLDNAEKYGRGAEDRTIRLAAADMGDAVEIVVADRGPGVSDDAKLFQVFSRGVTGDGPAGLGLGLALSQSLARAMGGELAYRPNEGGGAAFALRLPRA